MSKKKIKVEINIEYHIHIGDHIEQRAEGGGQILRNVGMNANQGGQVARDHSETANNKSQFANGNGRSGLAGKKNDELGGQQAIKVRDSKVKESDIITASETAGGAENAAVENAEAEMTAFRLPKLSKPTRRER